MGRKGEKGNRCGILLLRVSGFPIEYPLSRPTKRLKHMKLSHRGKQWGYETFLMSHMGERRKQEGLN
jgi:hypothetical protein